MRHVNDGYFIYNFNSNNLHLYDFGKWDLHYDYYARYSIIPDTAVLNGGTITLSIRGSEAGYANNIINGDIGTNFAFFAGQGIFQFYLSSANETSAPIGTVSSYYYNDIYAYDDNNVIAVGTNVISWTTNGSNLSNGDLKEQAINYCNQIKSSENGWKMCLNYSKESR